MVPRTLVLYLSSIFLFLMTEIHGKAVYSVILDSFACKSNPAYAYQSVCKLNKSFNPPHAHMELRMHREVLTQQYSLNLSISMNKRERTILRIRNYDACEFFEGRKILSNVMLNFFKQNLEQYGKLPKKCPVEKNFHYYFRDFVVEFGKLPPYMIETDFFVVTRNTAGPAREFLFDLEVRGRVRRNEASENDENTKKGRRP